MTNFKLKVIKPEGVVFEKEVTSVTVETMDGQITILANHQTLVSALGKGEMVIKVGEEITPLFIWGGFLEFSNNTLTVLAHSAEQIKEIDIELVQKAKQDAEALLADSSLAEPEYELLMEKLNKEKKKIELFNKWRS